MASVAEELIALRRRLHRHAEVGLMPHLTVDPVPPAAEIARTELPRLVTALGAAHRCTVETEFVGSYPVTHNDPAETTRVLELLDDRYGAERVVRLAAPAMASEDFAYVLDEVPGSLFFLGARPAGVPEAGAPAMHSPLAVFDDAVLEVQASTFAELALRRLQPKE